MEEIVAEWKGIRVSIKSIKYYFEVALMKEEKSSTFKNF